MIRATDNYHEAGKPATSRGLTQLGDSHSDRVERPVSTQDTQWRPGEAMPQQKGCTPSQRNLKTSLEWNKLIYQQIICLRTFKGRKKNPDHIQNIQNPIKILLCVKKQKNVT